MSKDMAREAVRLLITAQLAPLVEAQLANAKGLKYMVVRDADGKFVRIPDTVTAREMDALLASDSVIEVWTKDPSVQAFSDLMNRAIDKPKEQAQELNLGVSEQTLAILDRWKLQNRQREELEAARALTGKSDDS
jgi:hypothetical protein